MQVSNNPSYLMPVCQCIIKNHISDDSSVPKSLLKVITERKKAAIEDLCKLKPVIASNIRELTVKDVTACSLDAVEFKLLNYCLGRALQDAQPCCVFNVEFHLKRYDI